MDQLILRVSAWPHLLLLIFITKNNFLVHEHTGKLSPCFRFSSFLVFFSDIFFRIWMQEMKESDKKMKQGHPVSFTSRDEESFMTQELCCWRRWWTRVAKKSQRRESLIIQDSAKQLHLFEQVPVPEVCEFWWRNLWKHLILNLKQESWEREQRKESESQHHQDWLSNILASLAWIRQTLSWFFCLLHAGERMMMGFSLSLCLTQEEKKTGWIKNWHRVLKLKREIEKKESS